VCAIYSEIGMVQANTGGVVVEPDLKVLMMIRTIARFGATFHVRAPRHFVMCTAQGTTGRWVSSFLMFLCALLSVFSTVRAEWSK
jgi:hypothetical protein